MTDGKVLKSLCFWDNNHVKVRLSLCGKNYVAQRLNCLFRLIELTIGMIDILHSMV